MKVKNIIANAPVVKRFLSWLETAREEIQKTAVKPELLQVIEEYPIEELIDKNLFIFQRDLQLRRLIKIARKIIRFDFLFIPIILDEALKMIDGQHRVTVAYLLGMKTVPVAVYRFRRPSDKPDLFSEISMPEGGPPAILDRMNSRKIAKYPYESTIHRIITDDACVFYDKVVWKGSKGKEKITLPTFIKIFNWIGLGVRRGWQSENDGMLQHRTGGMTEEDYIELRERLNVFGIWFFSWAGDDRSANPDLYKEKIIVGFMDFYLHMIKTSSSKTDLNSMMKRSKQKFLTFNPANVAHYDYEGVLGYLLKEFNSNKPKHTRLKYQPMGMYVQL